MAKNLLEIPDDLPVALMKGYFMKAGKPFPVRVDARRNRADFVITTTNSKPWAPRCLV